MKRRSRLSKHEGDSCTQAPRTHPAPCAAPHCTTTAWRGHTPGSCGSMFKELKCNNLKMHLLSILQASSPTDAQSRDTTYFTISSSMRAEGWVYFLGNVVTKLFLVQWILAKSPAKFSVESTDYGKSGRKQAAGVSAGGRAASPALSALCLYSRQPSGPLRTPNLNCLHPQACINIRYGFC